MQTFLSSTKGAALLLSLMMTTLIALLVMFATAIGTGQLKMTGETSDSSRAFSAADAGIEYALSRINLKLSVGEATSCSCDNVNWCPASGALTELSSNAEFCVTADNPASPRKLTAVGRTKDTKIRRSIEILVPAHAAVNQFKTICYQTTSLNVSLDSICQNDPGAYAGATGLSGFRGGTTCATALVSGATSQLRQSSVGFDHNVADALLVQCYK